MTRTRSGRKVERLLDAVLDDDHRVAVIGEVAQEVEEVAGRRGIEVGERLVDDVAAAAAA